jgi:hypothetical protein
MKQMETAEVTITDLSPETVELLLQYCYGCLHKMPIDHAEVGLFPFSDLCTIPDIVSLLFCMDTYFCSTSLQLLDHTGIQSGVCIVLLDLSC